MTQKKVIVVSTQVELDEFMAELMANGDAARFVTSYGKPKGFPAEIRATRYANCGYGYTWELETIGYPQEVAATVDGEVVAVVA